MIALGFVLAILPVAPLTLQSVARDSAPEPVILEVALGRLASRTLPAFRQGNDALLPVGAVLELAEVEARVREDRFVAVLQPSGVSLTIDPVRGTVRRAEREWPFAATQLFRQNGEWFLAATVLGQLLQGDWNVNWPDLTATLVDPSALPLAVRITREWRRRTAASRGDGPIEAPLLAEPRRAIDGLVVDYGVFAPAGTSLRNAAYSTALGLDLFGGSFTAAVQSGTAATGGPRTDVAWAGTWRNNPWLAQARLGDGVSSGPRPRSVRGLTIGNAPWLRPNDLGEVAFTGNLGPGWEVEAYRGGRLLAYDSVNALGQYSIDAPIAYGENAVEFIAYGPFGEVRRFSRAHRVDANRVRAGRVEYGASLGACRTDRCDATANADVRYGLSTRWTAQAGLDRFWRPDSVGNLFHPYAGIVGSVGNAFGVQAEVVGHAIARTALRFEPNVGLALGIEATRFARGVADPIVTVPGRREQVTFTGLYRPADGSGDWFVEGGVDLIRTETGTLTSGRLGGAVQYHELQLLPAVRWQRGAGGGPARRTSFEVNGYLLPLRSLGPVLGAATARFFVEAESSLRPSAVTVFAGRNLSRSVRLEAGGGWSALQGPLLSVNVAANLQTVRAFATMAARRTGTTASQYVQGSVLLDRQAGRVQLSAGPSVERAGVAGRVFLDENGNERLDDGEPLLPNVRVSVGLETRVSDARGEYRLWNVTPYEPAVVAVDSATLASPLWVPTRAAVAVEPGPNRYRIVDIPIAPGGVIDGKVLRADSAGAPGVTLVLRHLGTGQIRRIVSFSDGEFYAMGIRPGEYELSLDPATGQRLGLAAEALRFTLAASADGAAVSGLTVRVRPVEPAR
ncbi:MAG: hypothetical protein AB7S39_03740 [Gemmatimonadales bacterium]